MYSKILFSLGVLGILISVAVIKNSIHTIEMLDISSHDLAIASHRYGYFQSSRTLCNQAKDTEACMQQQVDDVDTASRQFAQDLEHIETEVKKHITK
jgi:hypothetical protein